MTEKTELLNMYSNTEEVEGALPFKLLDQNTKVSNSDSFTTDDTVMDCRELSPTVIAPVAIVREGALMPDTDHTIFILGDIDSVSWSITVFDDQYQIVHFGFQRLINHGS